MQIKCVYSQTQMDPRCHSKSLYDLGVPGQLLSILSTFQSSPGHQTVSHISRKGQSRRSSGRETSLRQFTQGRLVPFTNFDRTPNHYTHTCQGLTFQTGPSKTHQSYSARGVSVLTTSTCSTHHSTNTISSERLISVELAGPHDRGLPQRRPGYPYRCHRYRIGGPAAFFQGQPRFLSAAPNHQEGRRTQRTPYIQDREWRNSFPFELSF